MFDEKFWVAVAFIIFISLTIKKISKIVASSADQKSSDIKHQLESAAALKKEAGGIRESYLKQKQDNIAGAKKTVSDAKRMAENIIKKEEDHLKALIEKKSAQAQDRIESMKQNALKELYEQAISKAVAKCKTHVANNNLDKKLVDISVDNLGKLVS
jgi:F-type H+-transporting ATPase subunit b